MMVYSPVNPWTFPVNPNFPWTPDARIISNITQGNPCIVTTTAPHGYSSGFNVRVTFPFPYSNSFGMYQINGLSGLITVLSPTSFLMPINTLSFDAFGAGTSSITNITKATKAVITVSTQNFIVGQSVFINGVGGMVEINGIGTVILSVSGSTVTVAVDSSGFSNYTSGGNIQNVENPQVIPIGQQTNADLDDFTQVNPPNPSTLGQVPIFQSPGLQAAGACSTSQT